MPCKVSGLQVSGCLGGTSPRMPETCYSKVLTCKQTFLTLARWTMWCWTQMAFLGSCNLHSILRCRQIWCVFWDGRFISPQLDHQKLIPAVGLHMGSSAVEVSVYVHDFLVFLSHRHTCILCIICINHPLCYRCESFTHGFNLPVWFSVHLFLHWLFLLHQVFILVTFKFVCRLLQKVSLNISKCFV